MNAAQRVIAKFGGQSALATLLEKKQPTVQYWTRTGTIPVKWHEAILKLAQIKGIDLSPNDFFNSMEAEAESSLTPLPRATHWGELTIGETSIPCYVLQNGERVFSLNGVVGGLIGTDGGQLAEYIKVRSLRPFLPDDLIPAENGEFRH